MKRKFIKKLLGDVSFIIGGLILGYVCVYLYNWKTNSNAVEESDYSTYFVNTKENIIIYTTYWCPGCKQAKEYLKSNNINYSERDIEANKNWANELSQLGTSNIPTLITKTQKTTGFNASIYDFIIDK